MDDEEVMQKARKAVILARKAVAEAERALQRTEGFFRSTGLDPETLIRQLEMKAGPAAKREIDAMVEVAMQSVRRETEEAIKAIRADEQVVPAKKRLRQLI